MRRDLNRLHVLELIGRDESGCIIYKTVGVYADDEEQAMQAAELIGRELLGRWFFGINPIKSDDKALNAILKGFAEMKCPLYDAYDYM